MSNFREVSSPNASYRFVLVENGKALAVESLKKAH
jgi:hypothetical protein